MAELLDRTPIAREHDLVAEARTAARVLSDELARDQFEGWDPYDALASPLLRRIARGRRGRQAAIQALKRSPVNLRPVLGVPRLPHTKALALLTAAHARLARADNDPRWSRLARILADRLVAAATPSDVGLAWGYDFDVQTRWGFYPKGAPNAVATAFAIHALLDADAALPGSEFREPAAAGLEYARDRLLVEREGSSFFGYYEGASTPIYNASLLLAGAFARGADDWSPARPAVMWALSRQAPDGSWPYGDGPGLEWVDGFHTGFNLEAVAWALDREDRPDWRAALARGAALYVTRLIDPDGAPRASLERRHPIDIHAAATAVTTLTRLARRDPALRRHATRVLSWTQANLRRADGRFAYQKHRRWRASIPYIRWGDGHMLLALATYVSEGRDEYSHASG